MPQVDLVARYRDAVGAEDAPRERAALLAEALRWLGPEAVPFVIERAGTDAMVDEERPALVPGVGAIDEVEERRRIMEALASRPGPRLAAAVFSGAVELSDEGRDRLAGSAALVHAHRPEPSWRSSSPRLSSPPAASSPSSERPRAGALRRAGEPVPLRAR